MKKFLIIVLAACAAGNNAPAQQRLVAEVKKDMGSLSLSVDNCRAAKKKLAPALTHDDTKGKAETWFVAGKIDFTIYDKLLKLKSLGKAFDARAAALSLLSGHDMFATALRLDTVRVADKKGAPVLDKKTGKQKVKTHYSAEITSRLLERLVDFSAAGGDLYLAGQWLDAYKAWDIYCSLAKSDAARKKKLEEPDSVVANYRYYQGMAAYEAGRLDSALTQFAAARAMGFKKKELYDTWIDVLLAKRDTTLLASVAQEAYDRYPAGNPRYVRIVINYYVRSKQLDTALNLLDTAIERDSTVAEYYGLKGHIIEKLTGDSEKAMALYRKAVNLDSKFGRGHYDLALALFLKGKALNDNFSPQAQAIYKEALGHAEDAHKLMPRSERAKKLLRQLYYLTGN